MLESSAEISHRYFFGPSEIGQICWYSWEIVGQNFRYLTSIFFQKAIKFLLIVIIHEEIFIQFLRGHKVNEND